MTPEGKVKKKVTDLLLEYRAQDDVWFFMPVPNMYQAKTLDYIGCVDNGTLGVFFAIETKRAGKTLNAHQKTVREDMEAARGKVFKINSDEDVALLAAWLKEQTTWRR